MDDYNFKEHMNEKWQRFAKSKHAEDYPSAAECWMVPKVAQREAAGRIFKSLRSKLSK